MGLSIGPVGTFSGLTYSTGHPSKPAGAWPRRILLTEGPQAAPLLGVKQLPPTAAVYGVDKSFAAVFSPCLFLRGCKACDPTPDIAWKLRRLDTWFYGSAGFP